MWSKKSQTQFDAQKRIRKQKPTFSLLFGMKCPWWQIEYGLCSKVPRYSFVGRKSIKSFRRENLTITVSRHPSLKWFCFRLKGDKKLFLMRSLRILYWLVGEVKCRNSECSVFLNKLHLGNYNGRN